MRALFLIAILLLTSPLAQSSTFEYSTLTSNQCVTTFDEAVVVSAGVNDKKLGFLTRYSPKIGAKLHIDGLKEPTSISVLSGDRRSKVEFITSPTHNELIKKIRWLNTSHDYFHLTIKYKSSRFSTIKFDKNKYLEIAKSADKNCERLLDRSGYFYEEEKGILQSPGVRPFISWAVKKIYKRTENNITPNEVNELVRNYNKKHRIRPAGYISELTLNKLRIDTGFDIIPKYDKSTNFHNGTAAIQIGNKWGLIDKKEKMIIKPKFDDVAHFNDQTLSVQLSGKWGLISYDGTTLVSPEYEYIGRCSDNICAFKDDESWGYIRLVDEGITKTETKLKKAGRFREGYSVALKDGFWILLDTDYKTLYTKEIESVKTLYSPSEGLSVFVKDKGKKRGFLDLKGNVKVKPKYLRARRFSEGLAAVKTVEGWGFININGDTIIPHKYLQAKDFNEGLAPVMDKRKKWGYINRSGKVVIAHKFELGYPFYDSTAIVRVRNVDDENKPLRAFIDKRGHYIFPFFFEDVYRFSEGVASVKFLGNWGFIRKK